MPHIPAFEIGAVFLLVALWLGLAKAREAFPEMLQNVKPFLLVCAVILLATAGYQTLPDLYRRVFPDKSAANPAVAAPASAGTNNGPQPKKATITEVEYILKVAPKPAASVAVVPEQLTPAKPVEEKLPEPLAAPEPTDAAAEVAAPKSENRGKKIIKSIGHALHFGRHKDDQ